jgi:gas vesicle protein
MTKNTKIALSLFAAAAAGAVVGMLLAPEKGKDLRKKSRMELAILQMICFQH